MSFAPSIDDASTLDDCSCAVCTRVFYDPIETVCHHIFCRSCLRQAFSLRSVNDRPCPLCRFSLASFSIESAPTLKSLTSRIKLNFKDEWDQRIQEARDERKAREYLFKKKFFVGNLHELMEHSPHSANSHKWTFIVCTDDDDNASKYLKKVTVQLHPTFRPREVVLASSPFTFTRLGWGVFMLYVNIQFKDHLEKSPLDLEHYLCFSGSGKVNQFEVEFDKRKFPDFHPEDQGEIDVDDEMSDSESSDNDE